MSDYTTIDSGERDNFPSGMRRDIQEGKPRIDLVSPFVRLRDGELMARGAEKYGENNWMLGQPFSRCLASLHRHLAEYEMGELKEDHLAAIRFNAGCLIHYEEMIERGLLDPALDDIPRYEPGKESQG